MLDEQIHALVTILKDKDVQQYAGDAFKDFIRAVVFHDAEAGLDGKRNVDELLFHMPNVLFWDKMKRYIYGTFRSFEDQVKLAARFENDDEKYIKFVKKQVALVDSIDEDEKIDYFARLTRCFLLFEIDSALYFKLVYLIKNCTVDELQYLEKRNMESESGNDLWVSVLSLQGLFVQKQNSHGNTLYVLSDIARSLKSCSLNFDEGMKIDNRRYGDLEPLPQLEPMVWESISELIDKDKAE